MVKHMKCHINLSKPPFDTERDILSPPHPYFSNCTTKCSAVWMPCSALTDLARLDVCTGASCCAVNGTQ